MMWVVYDNGNAHVYGKFYSKKLAKEFVEHQLSGFKKRATLSRVDMLKFDEWQMWNILRNKNTK